MYHFIFFADDGNIVGCFISRNLNKIVKCFSTTFDLIIFQNRIESTWFNSSFKLWFFFLSKIFKMADFQGIKDSKTLLKILLSLPQCFLSFFFFTVYIHTYTYTHTHIYIHTHIHLYSNKRFVEYLQCYF